MTITNSNIHKIGSILARNAAAIRRATGQSLKQFATGANLSESTIDRIENIAYNRASYNPTLRTVTKLAGIAGVTVEQLTQTHLKFV